MLARISALAGQINRHKNQQAGFVPTPQGSRYGPYHRAGIDGANHSNSWGRGGYPARGHYRARTHTHRHRTLILNGASQSNKASDSEPGALSDVSNSSWVTKNDRHLQLINASVYEKEAPARTRAIEETRRQKQALRDERERTKLINHLHRTAINPGSGTADSVASGPKYEVLVQGIRFHVVKNGSKLVKVPGTSATQSNPIDISNTDTNFRRCCFDKTHPETGHRWWCPILS